MSSTLKRGSMLFMKSLKLESDLVFVECVCCCCAVEVTIAHLLPGLELLGGWKPAEGRGRSRLGLVEIGLYVQK